MLLNQEEFETVKSELQYKKFPVLDDGHVMLIDVMGTDHDICEAARVSYGKGTKRSSDDESLIRYLMRQRHGTPFEMVEFKFRIRLPMDVNRQLIRHRTASVNEYSTRYSEAIDSAQHTLPNKWRSQSTANKQGSGAQPISWPDYLRCDGMRLEFRSPDGEWSVIKSDLPDGYGPGDWLSEAESELHEHARDAYKERLEFGVAREQARKDLPLSTYTELYWKMDLHNLLHFLSLRMDSHAQLEIRQYANTIGNEIVAKLVPATWKAFLDYHLDAMSLTRLDGDVIKTISGLGHLPITEKEFLQCQHASWSGKERCRERDECLVKLIRLGIVWG